MDGLSVYQDYVQTMAFLRASRNRITNSIQTTTMQPQHARECKRLCDQMYDAHVLLGFDVVQKLRTAMNMKHVPRATDAANQLHRHNRQTARLSRLFEEDVSDYHVDPDADYDENAPAKPVDASKPIGCGKFMAKMYKMDEEMRKAMEQIKASRQRAGTPKAPQGGAPSAAQ
jgi:hypothetical protein